MHHYIGGSIDKIDTPALIVEMNKLESNITQMENVSKSLGVKLRPHIKTHKIPAIAHMQLENGACGITAAKLSEAEVFVNAGIKDVFIAFPIVGEIKAKKAALLAKRCRLIVGVDSVEGITALSNAASEYNTEIQVRVEVDTGLGRSGVSIQRVEEIVKHVIDSKHLNLDGIFTHRGALFGGAKTANLETVGREEGQSLVAVAKKLRSEGYEIREISLGSSPTSQYAAQISGVTEIRPGTYVFNDMMQAQLGAVNKEDIALSILTTVVSKPSKGLITVDGGSKTFQGDLPADKVDVGLNGYAALKYSSMDFLLRMSEEHGVVQVENDHLFKIGDRVEIIPNHVCPTVNLSNYIIGVRDGNVEVVWEVAARGKRE
jgi:D-serine deaminase-like pyridoxal phosphate-dependent protein